MQQFQLEKPGRVESVPMTEAEIKRTAKEMVKKEEEFLLLSLMREKDDVEKTPLKKRLEALTKSVFLSLGVMTLGTMGFALASNSAFWRIVAIGSLCVIFFLCIAVRSVLKKYARILLARSQRPS
jgi:hypothetical protein